MSNRAKLLISILFIAAIVLTIGLTQFYFDVTKNNSKTGADDKVDSILHSFGSMQVFTNASGYCGVINADGDVVIEPEWMEILDVTPSVVPVSSRIGDEVLIGGIDYEENIILPFVYNAFQDLGSDYKAGIVAADGTRIIYRSDYQMAFSTGYDDAGFENGDLILTTENCLFRYSMAGVKPRLLRAEMETPIGGQLLHWRLSNQVFLSDLSEQDLLRISQYTTSYLDMLLQDDFSGLAAISSSDYISGLSKPGTMPDARIDSIHDFSFSRQEQDVYDLSFTASYRNPGVRIGSQSVQMHLLFRRGTDTHMLLTSANLDFQSAEKLVPAKPEPEQEDDTEEEDTEERS